MNYYKVTKIPKSKYILSYEIKRDIIIIKLANNEKYVVKNTIDNENKILERMNRQAALIIEKKKIKKISDFIYIYGLGLVILSILGYQTVFEISHLINGIISINNVLFTMFSIVFILYTLIVLRYYSKENQDLKKIKLYCETKELLNNNIKKSSINVFNKISFRTIKQISDKHMDEEPFTINSINKMSLRDLQTLKDNIEREKDFGLEEEPIVYKIRSKKKN